MSYLGAEVGKCVLPLSRGWWVCLSLEQRLVSLSYLGPKVGESVLPWSRGW